MEAIRNGKEILHLEASAVLAGERDPRPALLMDQVAEGFCAPPKISEGFIDNLVYAATVAGGQVIVILPVGVDFYSQCAGHEGLAAHLPRHHELIGPMDAKGLRAAIELPAQRAGGGIEPALVDL